MARFEIVFKKSALKQLRKFPTSTQAQITKAISDKLSNNPYVVDGIHIKKLTEGYRLRSGNYRIFYYIEASLVTITSIVRRTSTTY